jgi:pimeloyl-ACP methyl ester carboxylesterase
VTVPVLMFIGENDGVTPPAQHQLPMFDSLRQYL